MSALFNQVMIKSHKPGSQPFIPSFEGVFIDACSHSLHVDFTVSQKTALIKAKFLGGPHHCPNSH